jgi:hypothetical protein
MLIEQLSSAAHAGSLDLCPSDEHWMTPHGRDEREIFQQVIRLWAKLDRFFFGS